MYEPIGAQMLTMRLPRCEISAHLPIHAAKFGVIGDSTVTRKKRLFYPILLALKETEACCFVVLWLKSEIIINYYNSYTYGHPIYAASLFLTLRISLLFSRSRIFLSYFDSFNDTFRHYASLK